MGPCELRQLLGQVSQYKQELNKQRAGIHGCQKAGKDELPLQATGFCF